MISLLFLILCVIAELAVMLIGFVGYKAFHKQLTTTNNPLYMRCSCNHLASQHNMAGCCMSNCACRVTSRTVRRHGTYDMALTYQHQEQYFNLPELGMGSIKEAVEQEVKKHMLLSPNEVITRKDYK